MAKDWHEFRDPVHGFVILNDLERSLVDSRPFQRLRSIKQLATTLFVYPGAVHTRFEHSIGTLEMASRAFDVLLAKGGAEFIAALGWHEVEDAKRARQTLRLGALLHDIGHPPFSHAPEGQLLPPGMRHETYTENVIQSPEIQEILSRPKLFACDLDEITYLAVGPKGGKIPKDVGTRFLGELVFGDLGVDRIDYLVRDSIHLGVQYGRFDYARLLNTLTFTHSEAGDPIVGIEEGGIHSAEGLLLARHFMFLQVYFHPIRVLYDIHLVDFLREYLQPDGAFPKDVETYLTYNDTTIEAAMDTATGTLAELAEPFKKRSAFGLAYEVYPHDRRPDPEIFEKLASHLQEEFASDIIIQPTGGSVSIKEGDIPVVGTREGDILGYSDLTRHLVDNPIWRGRVYAKKEKREQVAERVEELMREIKAQGMEATR